MNEKYKPEYELGDRVSFDNKVWYVSGVRLKAGYEMICWEFELSSGFFGDIPQNGPEYMKGTKWLRHEQIDTVENWIKSKRDQLKKEKLALALKIKELESQERQLEQG